MWDRKLSMIAFTPKGIETERQLAGALRGLQVELFYKCLAMREKVTEEFHEVAGSVSDWAGERMRAERALVFVGAGGIAVRAVAPWINDKLQDSPVLVMDEQGKYVIPLLAGHVGGANELARVIGERTGAIPVITTATDLEGVFAVDLFAKRNAFSIVNREGIARVSAKALAGKELTLSLEPGHLLTGTESGLPRGLRLTGYPPSGRADILVSAKECAGETLLWLRPREYVIGMGCKKGKEFAGIEAFIRRELNRLGIDRNQVYALASLDRKREEPGFVRWSRETGIPFVTFTAEELERMEGNFHGSDFVRKQTGVDNVCERAALLCCGAGGILIREKCSEDGMTLAVAKREWRVDFDEK